MSRTPTPDEAKQAVEQAAEAAQPKPPARRLILTAASEIDPEPVVWAWEDESDDDTYGRIPAGSFGLLAGREGTGKSSALIWLAARVTRGELPGAFKGDPRAVIYMATEDSWKFTIVPRLIAAGADLDRVFRVEVRTIEDDAVTLTLPLDNRLLEQAITDNRVALVALDPMMSAVSENLDTHKNREVRQFLDPLVRIADRTGAVVAGISHFSKGIGTDAASLIVASGAFKDVARFIFAFATAKDGTQVITQVKNSLGRSNLPSLAYEIISATVETKKGNANVGRFVWRGQSEISVHDILGAHDGDDDERDRAAERDQAAVWLRDYLTDNNGEATPGDAKKAAREAGISTRTLERSVVKAGVQIVRSGFPARTVWRLCVTSPATVSPVSPVPATCDEGGETGETGETANVPVTSSDGLQPSRKLPSRGSQSRSKPSLDGGELIELRPAGVASEPEPVTGPA